MFSANTGLAEDLNRRSQGKALSAFWFFLRGEAPLQISRNSLDKRLNMATACPFPAMRPLGLMAKWKRQKAKGTYPFSLGERRSLPALQKAKNSLAKSQIYGIMWRSATAKLAL